MVGVNRRAPRRPGCISGKMGRPWSSPAFGVGGSGGRQRGSQGRQGFVLQAVTETGTALQFAHDDLRKDRDVALQTVKRWLVMQINAT